MKTSKAIDEIQVNLNILADHGLASTLLVTWPDGALFKISGVCSAPEEPASNEASLSDRQSA